MNKTNIKIELNIDITDENIDDIMTTALEGGINYWCNKVEVKDKDYKDKKYASDVLSVDGVLLMHDAEEDTIYELTKEKFINGLSKFLLKKGMSYFCDADAHELEIDCGMIDAGDADTIVQYALFGEEIYG